MSDEVEFEDVILKHTRVIEDAESSPEERAGARINRGGLYNMRAARGDWDRALDDYAAVVQDEDVPADERILARLNRGTLYSKRATPGDWNQALDDLAAVAQDEDAPAKLRALARLKRGDLYEKRAAPGDWDRALDDFSAVVQDDDAPPEQRVWARLDRGDLYEKRAAPGDWNQALDDFSAVVQDDDAPAEERAQARINRGSMYANRGAPGDWDRAFDDCTAVVQDDDATAEKRAEARVTRGQLMLDRNVDTAWTDAEQAELYYAHATSSEDRQGRARLSRLHALISRTKGKWHDAAAHQCSAVKLWPHPAFQRELADIYLQAPDADAHWWTEGIRWLRKAGMHRMYWTDSLEVLKRFEKHSISVPLLTLELLERIGSDSSILLFSGLRREALDAIAPVAEILAKLEYDAEDGEDDEHDRLLAAAVGFHFGGEHLCYPVMDALEPKDADSVDERPMVQYYLVRGCMACKEDFDLAYAAKVARRALAGELSGDDALQKEHRYYAGLILLENEEVEEAKQAFEACDDDNLPALYLRFLCCPEHDTGQRIDLLRSILALEVERLEAGKGGGFVPLLFDSDTEHIEQYLHLLEAVAGIVAVHEAIRQLDHIHHVWSIDKDMCTDEERALHTPAMAGAVNVFTLLEKLRGTSRIETNSEEAFRKRAVHWRMEAELRKKIAARAELKFVGAFWARTQSSSLARGLFTGAEIDPAAESVQIASEEIYARLGDAIRRQRIAKDHDAISAWFDLFACLNAISPQQALVLFHYLEAKCRHEQPAWKERTNFVVRIGGAAVGYAILPEGVDLLGAFITLYGAGAPFSDFKQMIEDKVLDKSTFPTIKEFETHFYEFTRKSKLDIDAL